MCQYVSYKAEAVLAALALKRLPKVWHQYDYECGHSFSTPEYESPSPGLEFMASLLDDVPYLTIDFILYMDSEYGFRKGFHLIWNVCINMTT